MSDAFILKETEGRLPQAYNVLGMPVYLKVAGNDTNDQISVFVAEYKKNQGPPLHSHDVDETFYVMEGEFIFQMGDNKGKAIAGEVIFVPRNMPHTTLTVSDTGKMLFIVNPAGNIEKIFAKLDAFEEMPPIEEIVRVHEELGLKILGPPLSL